MRQFEFIYGLHQHPAFTAGSVVTIGAFDGVHLGHQAILRRLIDVGERLQLPTVVVIFEPQPQEYFARERCPARLMRLREKVTALRHCGVDYVVCLKFNSELRSLTADQFIERVLIDQLAVKHLEIGDDFRFGCDRQGDFTKLTAAGAQWGFVVCDSKTLSVAGERVSSTRIRALLERDQLDQAAHLLSGPYSVSGRVVHGRQLGRSVGVPTANVALGRFRSPVQGVYAVRASLEGSTGEWMGVANVGVKPTVTGDGKPLLEVHLFDFKQDIYGQHLTVKFCAKLRKEQKFESVDALVIQLRADISAARNYFASTPSST